MSWHSPGSGPQWLPRSITSTASIRLSEPRKAESRSHQGRDCRRTRRAKPTNVAQFARKRQRRSPQAGSEDAGGDGEIESDRCPGGFGCNVIRHVDGTGWSKPKVSLDEPTNLSYHGNRRIIASPAGFLLFPYIAITRTPEPGPPAFTRLFERSCAAHHHDGVVAPGGTGTRRCCHGEAQPRKVRTYSSQ